MQADNLATAVAAHGLNGSMLTLPDAPLDTVTWAELLDAVAFERIPGLLVTAIDAGRLPATPAQRGESLALLETSMAVALQLERLLLDLAGHLDAARIPYRVLKGAAHAALVYPDPALRSFGDIDLLVPSDAFEAAVGVLTAAGCRRRWPEVRRGYDRRFAKGASLFHASGAEVDLHRTFALGPFGLRIGLDRLFERAQHFRLAGTDVPALSLETMFLHTCFHAVLGHVPPRLAGLRDVAELALRRDLDEGQVLELASAWDCRAVVAAAVATAWGQFALADATRLSGWAIGYAATPRERERLASYWGSARSHTAKSLRSFHVIPGVRGKMAFAWSTAFPSREFVEQRGTTRAGWLQRGVRRAVRGE